MYFILLYYQCFEQMIKIAHLNKLQSPIYRQKKRKEKKS